MDLTALLPNQLKPYAKLVYAILGVAALLVADGTLSGTVAHVVTAVAAVLTPAAVYSAENRDPAAGDPTVFTYYPEYGVESGENH